jgi:hypothetical protein
MLQQNNKTQLAAAKKMLTPNKQEELLSMQQPQIKKRLLKAPLLNIKSATTNTTNIQYNQQKCLNTFSSSNDEKS